MDIDYLREFVHLAQSRSFTETSRHFHIAQSTLSKHISNMEKELGMQLFVRTTTSVKLTEQGKILCQGCLASLSEYDVSLEKCRRAMRRTITVGGNLFVPTIRDALFLANRRFEEQRMPIQAKAYEPHMSEFVPNLGTANKFDLLDNHVVDALIVEGPVSFQHAGGYRSELLFHEPFVIFARCENPLTCRNNLVLGDLKDQTFAISVTTPLFYDRVIEACRESGFEPLVKTCVYDDFNDYLRGISTHELCAISKSGSRRVPAPPVSSLSVLDLHDERCTAPVYLVSKDQDDADVEMLVKTARMLFCEDAAF